jgi:hypothetical protein
LPGASVTKRNFFIGLTPEHRVIKIFTAVVYECS